MENKEETTRSQGTPGAGAARSRTRLQPVGMERHADRLVIAWNDGHHSVYAYADLRRACPCATCRTEREQAAPPATGLRVLPAGAPVIATLRDVQWVGWYAFRFAWEDGHDTGIYSMDYLRALCSCPECAGAGAGGHSLRESPPS
jgi:DUF971 family protein